MAQTITMEEDSWTRSFSMDIGMMSRTASEAPSARTSWVSCSSFSFEGFDDSWPCSRQGSLGSLTIKNTFIHLDPESSDSEDELDMRKLATAPPAPVSDEPSTCKPSLVLPEGALKGTKSYNGGRTPKVTFDLAPTFFEGSSEEIKMGSKSMPISHLSASSPFGVKNTFIHLDKSLAADSDLDLPTRSVSEPAILESCISPVASSEAACIKSSSCPGESSPFTVTKASELAPQLAGPEAPTPARGLPSVGAALHSTGNCKPCAWFWKPEGCRWGLECGHCHLCPVGELRRRKKEKQAEAKELKAAQRALQAS